ncbi:MAG: helical backbone metal receptor [Pseudomonadota bacterium]|nr:helical backbone metal receptor [Pseudomonadota bacterium]
MTITQILEPILKLFVIIFLSAQPLWAQPRIVALSPAINEIIFALGAGEQVVANTLYSKYPPESQNRYKVGGYFQPNLERILAIQPTMVILHPLDPILITRLKAVGIETLSVHMRTLDDIIQAIELIGQATDKTKTATRLVQKLTTKMVTTQQSVTPKALKILVVFGMTLSFNQGVYVAGQALYFNDIIQLVGCHNAFDNSAIEQPILTREGILATQADIVIILAHDRLERGLSSQVIKQPWQQLALPAARQHNIYVIDASYATIPSHRVIHLIDDFKAIVQKAQQAS